MKINYLHKVNYFSIRRYTILSLLLLCCTTVLSQTITKNMGTPCVGHNIYLNSSGGCTPSSWNLDGGTLVQTNGSYMVVVKWNTTGVKNVQAFYSNCSVTSASYQIDIKPQITPTVSLALSKTSVCGQNNETIQLTASTSHPSGYYLSYTWYVDNVQVATGSSQSYTYNTNSLSAGSHSAHVVMSTDYPCVTSNTATSASKTFSVNAKMNYTARLGDMSPICSNMSSVSFYTIVEGPHGSLSYQWYVNNSLQATTTNPFQMTPTDGATVYCKVYSDGCANSPVTTSPYTIDVLPVSDPAVSIDIEKLTYCPGETISFEANSPHVTTQSTYSWKRNGVQFSTSRTTSLAASATSGTGKFANGDVVSVTVNGLSGTCLSSTTKTVSTSTIPLNVKTEPNVTFTAGSQLVCDETTHTYTTQSGKTNYQWERSTGGTLISGGTTSSNSITIKWNTPSTNQYVRVNYTDTNGCSAQTPASRTVEVKAVPTTAAAGSNLTSSQTCGLTSVTLAGNTPTVGQGSWSIVSGTGGSLANASSPNATFSGVAGSTYTLRWTISNSPCTASTDDMVVTFNRNPTVAQAGSDQTGAATCGLTVVTLNGNNPSVGTGLWSIVSGTGGSFANASSRNTTFSGVAGNTYTLKWTISNSPCTASSDNMVVTFNRNPIQPVAGPDQTTCGITTVTLAANSPSYGTKQWSIVSGTGGSFGDISSPTSTFTGLAGNTYVLRWSIGNAPCLTRTDDVIVKFGVNPVNVPVISGNARFGPGALVLSATGASAGQNYRWTLNGTSQSGSQFTTPPLTASVTNYLKVNIVTADGCIGPDQFVSIDIYPIPVIVATNPRLIKGVCTSTLSTNATYDSYTWKNSAGNVVSTASSFETDTPDSYTVTVTKGDLTYVSEPFGLPGQFEGQNMNYIIAETMQVPGITTTTYYDCLPVESSAQHVQYFDGLGRIVQTVSTQASPSKYDLVQPVVYDDFGREPRKYLPFAGENDGRYKDNNQIIDPVSHDYAGIAAGFYNNSSEGIADDQNNPFAKTIFENSPLNRVIEQGAPGAAWQPDAIDGYTSTDRTVKFAYEANASSEVLMWAYTYPTETFPLGLVNAGSPGNLIYYPENVLHKKKTKDEHYNEVIEYTDKEGRIVLKRVQAVSGDVVVNDVNYASTYYIYDDFGRLATVIPPEATRLITKNPSFYFGQIDSDKNAFLARWAFRYAYDARGRMIMKQVPGAEPVIMVYDNRDRLVMTQDGVQRLANQWSYTKYDVLNRPILTGIYTHSETVDQDEMSDLISTTLFYETYNGLEPYYGYTNNVFPTENRVVLTITFYDNYDFLNLWPDDYQYTNDGLSANENGVDYVQSAASDHTVGLVTGTIARVLAEENITVKAFMKSVTFYDKKSRPIQIITDNIKGGMDRVSNLYDFTGRLLKAKTTHSVLNFKSHVNVRSVINGLEKMQPSNSWSAGASSVEMLPANTDGWLEFRVPQTSKAMMIGFSTSDPDVTWQSIDHALYLKTNAGIEIRQSGSNAIVPSSTTYTPGTVFRIERRGSNIFYYKDGLEIHQSPITTAALFVDVSLNSSGSKVVDMKSSFGKYSAKTITRTFEYDHAGRLTHSWHQIDDRDNVLVSFNEYNELGQLIDKKVHSTNGEATDAVQSVDYRYNIRGWLTSINNASLSLDNQTNDDTEDYFGLELGYDQSFGLGSASFNGNISAMKWSNNLGLSTIKEKAYAYDYDAMNRITSAAYKIKEAAWSQAPSNGFSESGYTYDLNGNIKSLTRYDERGSDAPMDVLEYGYGAGSLVSNQLLKVDDAGDDFKGFRDGTNAGDDYSYDKNGNMLTDLNKEITVPIVYNHLNLPQEITKGGHTINYVYDATGRKLAQVTSFHNTLKESDYAGDFHYDNGLLSFVNHEEGRVVLSEEESLYVNDGASVDDVVTFSATVSAVTLNDDQSYLEVTSSGSNNAGLIPVGGQFPASPGDHFRIRARGYRTGSTAVYLFARTNLGSFKWADDSWHGASLPSSHALETWVEETIIIPAGVTYLEVGARWVYSAAGDKFYINDFEVTKIFSEEEPEYQYHMKDHLGNVRLTYTTKEEVEESTATLETENLAEERSLYLNYDEAVIVNHEIFDHTSDGSTNETLNATRLAGGTSERYGLARSLRVMPGDKISMEVWAKYLDPNPDNWNGTFETFLQSYTSATPPAGVVVDGGLVGSIGDAIFPFAQLVLPGAIEEAPPKAFLSWIVFDKNFNPVISESGFIQIGLEAKETGLNTAHQHLARQEPLLIKEPGYVYIYLSNENETPVEVFFDDFKVEHTKSPVVQVDDYYPFGLAFNSYQRENSVLHDYKYNSKEEQTELGLGWYDYGARMYDPTCACWHNLDPVADAYYSNSPYSYVLGNPVSNKDVEGMWTVSRHNTMTLKALSTVGIGGQQAELIAHYASVYADNPGALHIEMNNWVTSRQEYVSYRSGIDYSGTANSQKTSYYGVGYNYNIWHSMRSGTEKNAYDKGVRSFGISAEGAMQRGLSFGWGKVFEAAKSGKLSDLKKNSKGIQALGQGLHALQDAYAHKGRHDVGYDHIMNDIYGDTQQAESISQSAVVVYKLMSNDFGDLKSDQLNIVTEGMSSDQINTVLKQIGQYFNYLNERKKKEEEKDKK